MDTSVTVAPRSAASAATAYPCLPELRLAMTRTASIGSRVPPADTTTRTPSRSRGPRTRRTAATIVSGSARRPAPTSPPASRPTAGSTMCTPRLAKHRDVLDDARVLPHLGVHRRADHDGRPRGDQRVGQQVGRQTHPVGGDQPGGRRGDDDQVGPLADLGVRDRGGRVVPELGLHRLGGQRARAWCDR